MARIPSIKRLLVEDYKDQKGWIGDLLQPLNTFMEQTTAALNSQLTVRDNLSAQIAKVKVTEGSVPVYVKVSLSEIPQGVFVSNVRDIKGKGFDSAVAITWEYSHETQQVKINNIFGLKAGQKGDYELTLYIHGS
jgi:hypothetical protein